VRTLDCTRVARSNMPLHCTTINSPTHPLTNLSYIHPPAHSHQCALGRVWGKIKSSTKLDTSFEEWDLDADGWKEAVLAEVDEFLARWPPPNGEVIP
jgi:hypothetical protein